jgi:hypothetical protein
MGSNSCVNKMRLNLGYPSLKGIEDEEISSESLSLVI